MLKLISPFRENNDGARNLSTKTLGMRRGNKPRRSLYDHNIINALILYTPPEVSEQEKLLNPK